jgi:hypothetical protein
MSLCDKSDWHKLNYPGAKSSYLPHSQWTRCAETKLCEINAKCDLLDTKLWGQDRVDSGYYS